jgi:hypothetical protein
MEALMTSPRVSQPISLVQSRTPVLELQLGASPPSSLLQSVHSFLATQLTSEHPPPASIKKRDGSQVVQVQLNPEAEGFGQLSRSLGHGGAIALEFEGSTRLIPVCSAAAVLPPGCVQMVLSNVPALLSVRELPEAVLVMAGYTVRRPPDDGVITPEPGVVTVCRLHLGRLC